MSRIFHHGCNHVLVSVSSPPAGRRPLLAVPSVNRLSFSLLPSLRLLFFCSCFEFCRRQVRRSFCGSAMSAGCSPRAPLTSFSVALCWQLRRRRSKPAIQPSRPAGALPARRHTKIDEDRGYETGRHGGTVQYQGEATSSEGKREGEGVARGQAQRACVFVREHRWGENGRFTLTI